MDFSTVDLSPGLLLHLQVLVRALESLCEPALTALTKQRWDNVEEVGHGANDRVWLFHTTSGLMLWPIPGACRSATHLATCRPLASTLHRLCRLYVRSWVRRGNISQTSASSLQRPSCRKLSLPCKSASTSTPLVRSSCCWTCSR